MLKVKNLSVFYDDAQALNNITFSINQGDFITIIGGNGAGKTSLIKALTGIVKPRSGGVFFNNQDITRYESHDIIELGIGHVAEGRQIFPTMTVKDNLEIGGGASKKTRQSIKSNLNYVFELFPRLLERQGQLAGTLSGGEQQMLAIGRCLMAEPSLIFFDEPSLGLSPLMVKEMFHIIKTLHGQGKTILLVEQNVAASLELASYAYVLENSEIVLSGPSHDLLHNDDLRKAYLGI